MITASTDASEEGGAYEIGRKYAGYHFRSQPNELDDIVDIQTVIICTKKI